MLLSTGHLLNYHINAEDGAAGIVQDFYFDDVVWTVRYVVVNTGSWLAGRRVLISPFSVGEPNALSSVVKVALSSDQLRNSPDASTDLPVSRQHEIDLAQYYSWPTYWDGIGSPSLMPPIPMPSEAATTGDATEKSPPNPHLRSVREVTGYHIHALDGAIGHVEDFLADTEKWVIRYVVVDTRNWLAGKKVLIPPAWIHRVNWEEASVHIDLNREQIKHSPPFDPKAPVNRDYESCVYDYYGRPAYWR